MNELNLSQSCFDLHGPLWVGGGDPAHNHRRHPIVDYETGLRLVYVRLPLNVTCDQVSPNSFSVILL
jgi:hypothetical protein